MLIRPQMTRVALVILTVGLISCSSSNQAASGPAPGPAPFTSPNPLTIDNAGVVPVLDGKPTSSVIFVHNHSDATISGISYSAVVNADGKSSFLDPQSAKLCASIAAHQSCQLAFTTPALEIKTGQGSALLKASYAINGKQKQFSQTISFERVDNTAAVGAVFKSGAQMSGAGNDTAYATVYLYGSGSNKVYKVEKISIDKSGVQVVNGDISGKQIQSNYVQFVRLRASVNLGANTKGQKAGAKVAAVTDGYNAKLTAVSVENIKGGSKFVSDANLGVVPATSGAILTSGKVPMINTAVADPSGMIYINNAGDAAASLTSIILPSELSQTSGANACGATLEAGDGCVVYFKLPQGEGNANLTVNYTSGGNSSQLVRTIYWYNSKGAPLLGVSANADPLSFSATLSGSAVVTVVNAGGYNVTGLTAKNTTTTGAATSTNSAISCKDSSNHDTGTNLLIGGSCSYTVTLSDSTDEIGAVQLDVSGSYNDGTVQTANGKGMLNYVSQKYQAVLDFSALSKLSIIGNNTETLTKVVTVTNIGEAPATISSSTLSSAPSYLTLTQNDCLGQELASKSSCSIELKLGPTIAQNLIQGAATYSISYSGGQQTGTTDYLPIDYEVQANLQNLAISSVVPGSGISGSGAGSDKFIIPGTIIDPTITVNYQNNGTNPIVISGVDNTNSPIAWLLDEDNSSCYQGGKLPSAVIEPTQGCSLVFKNVLAEYSLAVPAGVGINYSEDLVLPTIVFQDQVAQGTQFAVSPLAPAPISDTIVSVNGTQATVVNNAEYANGKLTITHSLANATGYPSLVVKAQTENYFSGTPVASNCTTSAASGIQTQTCTLNPVSGTALASVVYDVNLSSYPSGAFNVLFSMDPVPQVVSFTPLFAKVNY
jgi:hypothetical protein